MMTYKNSRPLNYKNSSINFKKLSLDDLVMYHEFHSKKVRENSPMKDYYLNTLVVIEDELRSRGFQV